jgi:hypothetical protein
MLRALTKNWEEFEVVFRRAWIIKSISPHFIRQNDPKESEDEESEDDWSPEESEEEESEDEESEDDGSPKEGEDAESEDDWSPQWSEHRKSIDEGDGACRMEVHTQCVREKKVKFRLRVPELLPQRHLDWWLSDWDKNDEDRCQEQVWFDNWVEVTLEQLKTVVGQDTQPLRALLKTVDKQDLTGVIGEFVTESKATNSFFQVYINYASDQCQWRTKAREDPEEEESREDEAENDVQEEDCDVVSFDQLCEDQQWLNFLKQKDHSNLNGIRDQSSKEEKREIKRIHPSDFNGSRDDPAVYKEKMDIKRNNHTDFHVI